MPELDWDRALLDDLEDKVEGQRDLIREAFVALDRFGTHVSGCQGNQNCTCGWRVERRALERKRHEQGIP